MRLINVHTLQFRIFLRERPRYAIASHRWLDAETTFQDFGDKKNTNQQGYRKIVGFADFVRKNVSDVDWLWIDTCCINKDSSTELQEAITSMFRWYRDAEICLALLSDVDTPHDGSEFADSVWFTRGWTLQELLASRCVLFLTCKWDIIGHKGTQPATLGNNRLAIGPLLHESISRCTSIPAAVLADFDSARDISPDVKRQWMSGRQTTRDEDKVYALIGILDVSLYINYGEGVDKAQRRLLEEVSLMKRSSERKNASFEEAKSWLNSTTSLDLRGELERCRSAQTCDWIVDCASSGLWAQAECEHRVIWLHGQIGLGKSVIAARLLQHFEKTSARSVAGFFCSANEDGLRKASNILRSCLTQLIAQSESLLQIVEKTRLRSAHQTATEVELHELLEQMTKSEHGVVMVIDGFDECLKYENARHEQYQYDKGKFLRQLVEAFVGTTSQLVLISRDELDIRSALCLPGQLRMNPEVFEHIIQPEHVYPDLFRYCSLQVDSLGWSSLSGKGLREEVLGCQLKLSDGMFLCARLLNTHLAKARNVAQLRKRLEQAPRVVEELYDRYWQRIRDYEDDFEKERVLRTLRWVTFAPEPMSVSALFEAVAIENTGDRHYRVAEEWLPMQSVTERLARADLLEACKPFLVLKHNTGQPWTSAMVGLSRSSMRRFLVNKLRTRGHEASSQTRDPVLAELCLGYLTSVILRDPPTDADPSLLLHPFFPYAVRNWESYLDSRQDAFFGARSLLESLFLSTNPSWESWRHRFERLYTMSNQAEAPAAAGSGRCYCAVALGANFILQGLLQERTEATHVVQDELGSALELAFRKGSLRAVKLLLDHGAATTSSGTKRMANLIRVAAAAADGLELIKLILQHCVGDSKDASSERRALLDSGDSHDQTPLMIATTHGHRASIAYLIQAGVDLDRQDLDGRTAFYICVRSGWNPIATDLLNAGADCSLADNDGIFPMSFVMTEQDNETSVALPLALEYSHQCPSLLRTAARRGDSKLVSMLLPYMVTIDQPDDQGRTPLYIAVVHQQDAIVELLLHAGPKLNVVDQTNCPLLWHATNNGYDALIELILDSEVTSDVLDYQFTGIMSAHLQRRTVLMIAAERGRLAIVVRLMDLGADPYIADANGWMALPLAVIEGHCEIVEALVRAGVAIELRSPTGRTLLQMATENGDSQTVQVLVDAGASSEDSSKVVADRRGDTALHSAVRREDIRMVRNLLAAGADPVLPNKSGKSAFYLAVKYDLSEVLQSLITHMTQCDNSSESLGIALVNAASTSFSDGARCMMDTWMGDWMKSNDATARIQEAFVTAFRHNQIRNVKYFVGKGAVADKPDVSGRTILFDAVLGPNLDLFEFFFDEGCSVEQTGPNAQKLLYAAAEIGHELSVRILIRRGANVECASSSGCTPLFVAAEKGYCAIVKILLDAGANQEHKMSDGRTPISVAAENGHLAAVKVLSDAARQERTGCDRGALIVAAPKSVNDVAVHVPHDRIAQKWRTIFRIPEADASQGLQSLSQHVNDTPGSDNMLRTLALLVHRPGNLKDGNTALFDNRSSLIASRDRLGRSFLHVAAAYNHVSSIKVGLDAGLAVGILDKQHWTPLHWAAYFGHAEMCSQLLEDGADLAAKDRQGWRPARVACSAGHSGLYDMLRADLSERVYHDDSEAAEKWSCDACGKVSVRLQFSLNVLPPLRHLSN
jgi:ankyrin repeat protein